MFIHDSKTLFYIVYKNKKTTAYTCEEFLNNFGHELKFSIRFNKITGIDGFTLPNDGEFFPVQKPIHFHKLSENGGFAVAKFLGLDIRGIKVTEFMENIDEFKLAVLTAHLRTSNVQT